MLFKPGTKVALAHTGDAGIVRRRIDEDMLLVYLVDIDMEIPVPERDLKFIGGDSEVTVNSEIARPKGGQNSFKKEPTKGIQFAFEPILQKDGTPERYGIYLLNDLDHSVAYAMEFYLSDTLEESWNGIVASQSYTQLDELFYSELNEVPTFDIECRQVTSEGQGAAHFKTYRLKPKVFFKSIRHVPLLNKKLHWVSVMPKVPYEVPKKETNLSEYTRQNANSGQRRRQQFVSYNNPMEYAAFDPVIDLHIENLHSNWVGLSNSEIMEIQLRAFENFMREAIRIGVSPVFVIHGLGKGKLKAEVGKRLAKNRYVTNFKNEYHHKFGWGATEIFL